MHRQLRHFTLLLFALSSFDCSATVAEPITADEQRNAAMRCKAILVDSLAAQGEWSSVHAAEYLIHLDEKLPVLAAFQPQADCETPQYRIGVWRVLAQAEAKPDSRRLYVQRIRDVLLDLAAEDRLHALESLAKLNAPIASAAELRIVEQFADSPEDPGRAFAIWRLVQKTSTPKLVQSLLGELESSDQVRRLRAAFVLGQGNELPQPIQAKLQSTLGKESRDSIVFPFLAIAAGDGHLVRLATAENLAHRALALKELTRRGIESEIDFASPPIDSAPLAYRQAAAFALLAKLRKSDVQQNP